MGLNLRDSVDYNVKLFKFCGLWFYPTEKFYKFFKIFVILLIVNFNVITTGFVIFNHDNYLEISDLFSILPNTWGALIKHFIFRNKFAKIQRLLGFLDDPKFQPKNPRQSGILERSIKLSKIVFGVFYFVAIGTAVLFAILPLFSRKLPWQAWLPFEFRYRFEYLYVAEISGIFFIASTNVAADTFFAVNMIEIGAQFDVLSDDIAGIVDGLDREFSEGGSYRYFQGLLVDLIEHHRIIVDYGGQLLEVFNEIILLQFSCSVVVICMTTFVLSTIPPNDLRFLLLSSYEVVIFVQIFLYCWFGNEISVKSDRLSYSIFEADWLNCPLKFQKDLLFFMLAIKKPMTLIILDLIPVNLLTFTGIVRSAFGYFTALCNLRK